MACSNCGNSTCGCDELTLPIGPKGDKGDPSCLAFSTIQTSIGATGTAYVPIWTFLFSDAMAEPFTAFKANVYVSGGEGRVRVRELISNTILLEYSVSSTDGNNIVTVTNYGGHPLCIYPAVNSIIEVSIIGDGTNYTYIKSSAFYYL